MGHPYGNYREKHPGKSRVGKVYGYARGGKVKSGKTNINIIVTPGGGDKAPPPLPPMPMGGPPPGPMPMKPPMGGPPMGPPGPGMMNRGGKVSDGLSTSGNLSKWAKRAASNSYAKGGKVTMKGGAETGVGRLNKVASYAKRARKK